MIIYDLKCNKGHVFEGWFKDRETWVLQSSHKLISCPICNNSDIEIVPSSITIMGKDSKTSDNIRSKDSQQTPALKMLHDYLEKHFEDVGDRFAEVALKIHYGEEEKRNIKGTSTLQEEENLKEEGVQFIKVPLLKMDS